MVNSSRKDLIHGSSDLQTLHIISISIGGIIGSSVASVVTTILHPYAIFSIYIIMGLLYIIFAFLIDNIKAPDDINVSENLKKCWKHLSKPIVFKSLIFMFVSRAIVPSYGDIMYYWMIDVLNFNKTIISLLALIAFATAILGSMIYNLFLKEFEFKNAMILAHILIAISTLGMFLLVTRISYEIFHINDIVFAVFGETTIETLFVAFVFMPTLVLQTKIIPKNVEATLYSFFSSFVLFAGQFISPMLGGAIATTFGVSRDNFSSMGTIILIEFLFALIPLTIVWILPSNKQIEEFSENIKDHPYDQLDLIERQSFVYRSLSPKHDSNNSFKYFGRKWERFASC